MKTGLKTIVFSTILVAVLPFVLSGCKKQVNFPSCKKDADCRVDASGKEINGVCYMGKCEECVADNDCSDLKQCVNNRCLSSCTADADCGANSHCENSYCMTNCSNNDDCGSDKHCSFGRCLPHGQAFNGGGECQGLSNVYFDFDRTVVKDEYVDQVTKLANCLKNSPNLTVVIEGHTDDRGTPTYNFVLGQKRADAVKAYLNRLGIASNRIKTVSHGEEKPAVNENSEYAWQQNRRAFFVLENN